ncbi:MAG: hypothetical protein QOI01_5421 [Mycobacterium sp.]|jgi:hypothetical protein|nr:hypothetical protein [Mycobacterium sp.]
MVKIVSFANVLLIAGGLTVSAIGFAGLAAAEPVCGGAVPSASSHKPFTNGSAGSASCADALDKSDTSMGDIASAGSYANGSAAFTYAPWMTAG